MGRFVVTSSPSLAKSPEGARSFARLGRSGNDAPPALHLIYQCCSGRATMGLSAMPVASSKRMRARSSFADVLRP